MYEDAPSRYTSIAVEAIVEADASDAEIEKLLAIAERGCTVSNTISRGRDDRCDSKVADAASA